MKYKITGVILILIMFFTMSCSNENVGENNETENETPAKDMNGYEFKFIALTDLETVFFPPPVDSEYGDKILARYADASAKFNCNVNVSAVESPVKTQLVAAAASGVKYADLVDTQARQIYESMEYYLPLDDLPGFDINDKKWGPINYLQTAKFNGKHYGFTAYKWGIPYPQYIGNLFFRPSTMTEFNLKNPQELYEQKQWTWDNFREYSRTMTVKGATEEENHYGFVVSDEMKFPRAFIISNGGNPIDFDPKGNKYVYGLTDPKAQQALQYIKDMLDEGIGFYTKNDDWQKAAKMFTQDKTTGFYEAFNKQVFVIAELRLGNLGEPYSWVPYPCGPSGTYGKSTAQFWITARFLGLVNNFLDDDELENNIILLNYIFEPLEGETDDSWREKVKRRFFFDDLSFKYYIDLYEGGSTDFSAVAYKSVWEDIPKVYRNIFSGKMTISEAALSIADKVNDELDKLINPYLEG